MMSSRTKDFFEYHKSVAVRFRELAKLWGTTTRKSLKHTKSNTSLVLYYMYTLIDGDKTVIFTVRGEDVHVTLRLTAQLDSSKDTVLEATLKLEWRREVTQQYAGSDLPEYAWKHPLFAEAWCNVVDAWFQDAACVARSHALACQGLQRFATDRIHN